KIVDGAVIGAEAEELADRGAQFQTDVKQFAVAVGIGFGLQKLDGVAGGNLLGQVDVVGVHRDDALGGRIVDVMLTCRLPYGSINRGQVGDVDFLGIFF